MDIFMAT